METEFDNKDNFSAITTFTANKMAAKNRPKPVIRNLKLVEPSETLLKLLVIKDEEADIYQQNKSLLDPNYQVIKGEVEVNGITFDLCLVISKDEQIFTDEVIANSNMTPEQIEKYKQGKPSNDFEEHIINSFNLLSNVNPEILRIIKNDSNPIISFKSSKKFDFYAANKDNIGGFANARDGHYQAINVNFNNGDKYSIVHEFGHLFDAALGITGLVRAEKLKEKWEALANKYANGLKMTTFCGNELSGYGVGSYKGKIQEFFADLFNAYFIGDKIKNGPYLIEFLDKDAYEALEEIINIVLARWLGDNLSIDYGTLSVDIESLVSEYKEDEELFDLMNEFIKTINQKLLHSTSDQTHNNHFNSLAYYTIKPMLEELIKLHKEYTSNHTEENRMAIKDHLESSLKKINQINNTNEKKDFHDYQDIIDYLESIKRELIINDILVEDISDFIETLKNYTPEERTYINKDDILYLASLWKKCIEDKRNPDITEESISREQIKDNIKRFYERVKEMIALEKESNKMMSVEEDPNVSKQNIEVAQKKIDDLYKLLEAQKNKLPEEDRKAIETEINELKEKTNELSQYGLTNTELKICLLSMGSLINKLTNYYSPEETIKRCKEKVDRLYYRVTLDIKEGRESLFFSSEVINVLERLKEFLDTKSLFEDIDNPEISKKIRRLEGELNYFAKYNVSDMKTHLFQLIQIIQSITTKTEKEYISFKQ